MTKYIIDGEVLDAWERDVAQRAFDIAWQKEQIAKIRSHPYQSERDKVLTTFVERIKERQYRSNYGDAPYDYVYVSDIESALELFLEELRQAGEP